MNKGAVRTIHSKAYDFPQVLASIPDPPQNIYVRGPALHELLSKPCIAVVGSRKVSSYGRAVTTQIVSDLCRAGVVIISGLAIGVDAIAHRAALEAKGLTIAVLAGGLGNIYPSSHAQLARQILQQGGALVSEYAEAMPTLRHQFVARNRLVSGLSMGVLITEAAEKSGTLHTANFALEQGRDVFVVPGNITSPTSVGTNKLIKAGAAPVTAAQDILQALGITNKVVKTAPIGQTAQQQCLIDLLSAGETDGAKLLQGSKLDVAVYNQTLTMLEIRGVVRSLGGNQWALLQ